MLVNWNGYCFDINYEDPFYTATCQRTGKVKTRFDRNVWRNPDGTRVNSGLVIALEQGVSDWKSANAPRVLHRPASFSVQRTNMNSGRPARVGQKRFGREAKRGGE